MAYEDLLRRSIIRSDGLTEPERRKRVADTFTMALRDLEDARLPELSVDRRHNCAYEAARGGAEAVMTAEGYRSGSEVGRHASVMIFLRTAAGGRWRPRAVRFDRARRKRNYAQYERAGTITETEAEEVLALAEQFLAEVREWLAERGLLDAQGSESGNDSPQDSTDSL